MPWIKLTRQELAEKRARSKRSQLLLSAAIFCLVLPVFLYWFFDAEVGFSTARDVFRQIGVPVLLSAFMALVIPRRHLLREKMRYGTTMLCVDCENVCSDHAARNSRCACGGRLQPLENFRWED